MIKRSRELQGRGGRNGRHETHAFVGFRRAMAATILSLEPYTPRRSTAQSSSRRARRSTDVRGDELPPSRRHCAPPSRAPPARPRTESPMKVPAKKTAAPWRHTKKKTGLTFGRVEKTKARFMFDDTLEVPLELRIEDDDTVVLYVPDHPDFQSFDRSTGKRTRDGFLITGRRTAGGFFAGEDAESGAIARWALLGDTFVGLWREAGIEFLFSFSVPRKGAR
jgi:hypothetical protein